MCATLLRNSIKCINFRINAAAFSSRTICTSAIKSNWRKSDAVDVERMLVRADQVPDNYQLIYRAPLENYVTWSKNVSTATVTIISLIAGYQLVSTMSFVNIAKKIDLGILISNESDLYYFTAGFLLINLAIRVFVAKYPLRIYKSDDKYVAIYGSQLPVGIVKHSFERGQIAEYRNVLNPWSQIMYKLGNRSSMLLIDYFKSPSEFHQLFEEKET